MPENCDIEALVDDVKCFECLSEKQLEAIKAAQLCIWATNEGD